MVYNNRVRRLIVCASALLAALLLLLPVSILAAEEEKVEVSIYASGRDYLGQKGAWNRLGQRLVIDGVVTKIGYMVWRIGEPEGDITFSIYDAITDEVLFSQVWGDASELPLVEETAFQHVTLIPPLKLGNREVRLCVEYYGGDSPDDTDYVVAGYFSGDKITGQSYTNHMHYGYWHDIGEAEEGSYYLEYIPNSSNGINATTIEGSGTRLPLNLLIVVGLACLLLVIYLKIRKRAGV